MTIRAPGYWITFAVSVSVQCLVVTCSVPIVDNITDVVDK